MEFSNHEIKVEKLAKPNFNWGWLHTCDPNYMESDR
jgi:hypothetical protein